MMMMIVMMIMMVTNMTGINKSLESREISRNTDLSRSLSLEKIEFSFLFLFSIMKIFRENSLSLLDLWDFEK